MLFTVEPDKFTLFGKLLTIEELIIEIAQIESAYDLMDFVLDQPQALNVLIVLTAVRTRYAELGEGL